MAEFEAACQNKSLNLFVLPPKSPQLNGAVERNQGAWRYEFYESYDLPHRLDQLQPLVDAFAHRFNHIRPHDALDLATPAEYLASISQRDPTVSHVLSPDTVLIVLARRLRMAVPPCNDERALGAPEMDSSAEFASTRIQRDRFGGDSRRHNKPRPRRWRTRSRATGAWRPLSSKIVSLLPSR